jgi:hypothetical protein
MQCKILHKFPLDIYVAMHTMKSVVIALWSHEEGLVAALGIGQRLLL